MSTAVVHRLEGVVRRVDTDIPYLAVYCAEVTDHRRVIYLEPWAVRSAKVGDRVIVEDPDDRQPGILGCGGGVVVSDLQTVRQQIRETRAEMKAKGIKRLSCFNGGHTSELYRLNARMFQLESELKRLKVQP